MNTDKNNQVYDSADINLPYVSPSPGEFPILGSTICVDGLNPTREDFVNARECGLSAGSTDFQYRKGDPPKIESTNALTNLYKPAISNTGIGIFVLNSKMIVSKEEYPQKHPFDNQTTAELYRDYMQYTVQQPFVKAIIIADEPKWLQLVDNGNPLTSQTYTPGPLTDIYLYCERQMNSACNSEHLRLRQLDLNLLPSTRTKNDKKMHATIGPLPDYYTYLRAVQKLLHPMCWSFDLYPAHITPDNKFEYDVELKRYYEYLDRFLQISLETKRPFRTFCLTTEFENTEGHRQAQPNINRLRFETFTALAYGAQEIQYWTFCQRSNQGGEIYISSPINRLGMRNQIWYSLRQVNREIRQFTEVFMGCRVLHIDHIGNNYVSPLPSEMPAGTSPGFMGKFTAPLTIDKVTEDTEGLSDIFKGVMVSYLQNNPDNPSTSSSPGTSSGGSHTENYAVVMTHDPDNYKTVRITFKSGYEITEITPRILCGGMDAQSRTITRELIPGGYLIFRYRKV